jgi:hypothetical protein
MIPFLRIRWTTCLGLLLGCVLIQQLGASLGVIAAFVNFAVSNSSAATAATSQITKWTALHPGAGIYVVTRSMKVAGPSDPWLSFGCLRTYPDKVFFGVTYKPDAPADATLETNTLQQSILGTILTIGDTAPRAEPGRQGLGATIAKDGRWNFTYVMSAADFEDAILAGKLSLRVAIQGTSGLMFQVPMDGLSQAEVAVMRACT